MTFFELFPVSAETWSEAKDFLERLSGIDRDTLHVLAAPCIQLLLVAIMRTSLRSVWPWLILLALTLANEWSDLQAETWPSLSEQYGEGAKDIFLTMALPSLLLVVARIAPGLLVPPLKRS